MREFSSRKGGCHRGWTGSGDSVPDVSSRYSSRTWTAGENCSACAVHWQQLIWPAEIASRHRRFWFCAKRPLLFIGSQLFHLPPLHTFWRGEQQALPARNARKKAKLVRMQEKQKRNWQRGGEAWRGDGKKGRRMLRRRAALIWRSSSGGFRGPALKVSAVGVVGVFTFDVFGKVFRLAF